MGMYPRENPYTGMNAHFFSSLTLVQYSTQPTRGRPLAGGVIHYADVPLRFETFSSADQAKIRPRMAALHYQSFN